MAAKKTKTLKATKKSNTKKSKIPKNTILRVINRFNVASTPIKLVVFVFTFAVLGGSYMAYRSYAATTFSTYAASGSNIDCSRGRMVTESSGSKSSLQVCELPPGRSFASAKTSTHPAPGNFVWARACASARTMSGTGNVQLYLTSGGTYAYANTYQLRPITGTSYSKICSSWSSSNVNIPLYVHIVNHSSSSTVRFSTLYIEFSKSP